MRKTYEYNDQTGTYYEIEDLAEGGIGIRTMQDVEPVIDHVRDIRNDGRNDRGIKENWWPYATVPAAVWLKWKSDYGVDIFNKNHKEAVFKLLNGDFKNFKRTELNHVAKG